MVVAKNRIVVYTLRMNIKEIAENSLREVLADSLGFWICGFIVGLFAGVGLTLTKLL
jgi:hypothetical protein